MRSIRALVIKTDQESDDVGRCQIGPYFLIEMIHDRQLRIFNRILCSLDLQCYITKATNASQQD